MWRRILLTVSLAAAMVLAAGLLRTEPAAPGPGSIAATDIAVAFDRCTTRTAVALSKCIADDVLVIGATAPSTIAAVYAWNTAHPEHGSVCHNVAHYLGQSWSTTHDPVYLVGLDTNQCDGGLVHGVVEALAFTEDDEDFESVVASVCVGLEAGTPAHRQCVHGVGHALVLRNPGEFMTMVNACQVLPEADQPACYTAVLMSYATNAGSLSSDAVPVPVPRMRDEEARTACTKVPEVMRPKCWEGVWQLFPRNDALLATLLEVCAPANAGTFVDICHTSIGQMLFQTTPHGDTPTALRDELIGAIAQCPVSVGEACTRGAASSARSWFIAMYGSMDRYISACDAGVVQHRAACRAGESPPQPPRDPQVPHADVAG